MILSNLHSQPPNDRISMVAVARLTALPNELVYAIAEFLTSPRDLNSFSQSCSGFVAVGNSVLYERNAQRSLLWGAENGCVETVRKALCAGADTDVEGLWGFTPLLFAIYNGHMNVVKLLLAKGANVNMQTSCGWTALEVASRLLTGNIREEVALLLSLSGAELIVAERGSTALRWAEHPSSSGGMSRVQKKKIKRGPQAPIDNILTRSCVTWSKGPHGFLRSDKLTGLLMTCSYKRQTVLGV